MKPVAPLLILLLCLCFSASALATSSKDDGAIDWSGFMERAPQTAEPEKPKMSFFDQCMVNINPALSADDRALQCGCMTERDAALSATPGPKYWRGRLKAHEVSPYDRFVADIAGPCLWYEADDVARAQCLSEPTYVNMFRYRRDFIGYCNCYATEAQTYIRENAQLLLSARLAEGYKIEDALSFIQDDMDYRIYMEIRRKACLSAYDPMASQRR